MGWYEFFMMPKMLLVVYLTNISEHIRIPDAQAYRSSLKCLQ